MELTRQKMRDEALQQFKYIRTCVLARELCLLVRTHRVAFTPKDAQACCSLISNLCKEAGCTEASQLCAKASEALQTSEEAYLELCQQSCMKCGEARRPVPKRTSYVA